MRRLIVFILLIFAFLIFLVNFKLTAQAIDGEFVRRVGADLYLGTQQFKSAGPNIYWLGLDENVGGINYPTHFRIDDALSTAQEMGATAVRSFALLSVGCPKCIQPSLGVFNSNAFDSIDYAISVAKQKGVKLILPLVDGNYFYLGGKKTYANWRGVTNDEEFYTNPLLIADYKNHISYVLNHVNPYTGVTYKDESIIMAWETGNEVKTSTMVWPSAWTQEIADYIKGIDANHLVVDGHYGVIPSSLTIPSVDIYSNHHYSLPPLSDVVDESTMVKNANKAFMIGEYDWTSNPASTAQATITQGNIEYQEGSSSAKVDVTQSATYWYIQLKQANLAIESSQNYTLSFWAKSSIPRNIRVSLQKATSPFTTYFQQTVSLETSWQLYTINYSSTVTDANSQLVFSLAEAASLVWLDNISFQETSGNLLQNHSFENPAPNWLSPWVFSINGETTLSLSDYLTAIEDINNSVDVNIFWSLFGHKDTNGFVPHLDGYTFHYTGDTQDMEERGQQLRTHSYHMSNIAIPSHKCSESPLLWPLSGTENNTQVNWRGVVAAKSYNIERSTDGGLTYQLIKSGIHDNDSPWTDTTGSLSYLYRVAGVNLDSLQGDYSDGTASTICPTSPSPSPTPSPTPTPTPSPTPTPDIIPPTVTITNPLNGTTVVKGSTVNVTADSADNTAVAYVEFYVNNALKCTDINSPYSCSWKVPLGKKTTYSISAKSFDTSGNNSSDIVSVTSK